VKVVLLVVIGMLIAGNARGQALLHDVPETIPTAPTATTTPPRAAAPVFKSRVDLVALNVVVTDRKRHFVTGLQPQDFAVYEDGVKQDVSFFAATAVPLDLAILLDTSASMTDKLRTVQQAATSFAATLRHGDRAMVVDIKDATRILQPLTADVSAVDAAIAHTEAKGGTALYNGLYLTLKELTKQRRLDADVRRQAIVVLSDGEDTASLVAFDDVMAQAKEANIAVYTIMLKSAYRPPPVSAREARFYSESDFAMKSLAQETGAQSFFPTDIGGLSGVYASIAQELASQYALGYISKNPVQDGRYRRLVVRIEDHPEASLRTRSGYLAPRASAASR